MSHRLIAASAVLLAALHTSPILLGAGEPLPVKNGRPVVATVNGDAISLDEFVMQAQPTANRARLRQGRATPDELTLLDRMVSIKLIVQEATTMGLADVPEIRKQVEVSSREILREVLIQRLVKNLSPDPAAVERRYRESVRQWKTASILFREEPAAQRARMEIANGAAFDAVASKAVAAKIATVDNDPAFHSRTEFLPQVGEPISKLRVGEMTPVIRLQSGFAVVKVIGIRYPVDAAARAEARKSVLNQKQQEVLKAHEQALRRQYVVINEALLKSIDFAASKPGLNALLVDKRVVAEIRGGASVTVGDLTDYLRMQYFHGGDEIKQHKEMNAKKEIALDATIGRRLLNMEAVKLRIDKTAEYRDRVNGYRDSLVFDSFVQKVIVPENKMKEEEVKGYYAAHLKEYSYPEMLKIRGLAFAQRSAAEDAINKLRNGTDYGWLAANADGQVAKDAQGLLTFDGRPVLTDSMPDGVKKALAGSKTGDLRLYTSPEGHFYVLAVQQVGKTDAKPYAEVRQEIAEKLYAEKLKKSVADYAQKLRAQSKVVRYLKGSR